MSLATLARKALPELPADAIDDMVRGQTLAENMAALVATMPEIAEPTRWHGLAELAREMGLENMADRPLALIDLVESAAACG
jgi:hypothetical protein